MFDRALAGEWMVATGPDGRIVPALSEVERWQAPADEVDRLTLSRCEGPVLDIGCGPGRIVTALAERGIPALGVDVSAQAVLQTTERGAPALRRPVQEPLPGEGRWGTVLLMDGNIGIGGAPAALLRRCAELVRPGGLVLVEVDPDDELDDAAPIVLRSSTGRQSTPLPWARVGSRAVLRQAVVADLAAIEEWRVPGRAFLAFRRRGRLAGAEVARGAEFVHGAGAVHDAEAVQSAQVVHGAQVVQGAEAVG